MGPYYQTFSSCFSLQNLLVTVWLYDLLQGHIRSFPCPPKKISQIRLIPYSDVTSGQAACIHAFLCFKLSLLVWTRLFSKRVDLWVRNREKLQLCYTQVHYLCRQQPLGWCCFHLVPVLVRVSSEQNFIQETPAEKRTSATVFLITL